MIMPQAWKEFPPKIHFSSPVLYHRALDVLEEIVRLKPEVGFLRTFFSFCFSCFYEDKSGWRSWSSSILTSFLSACFSSSSSATLNQRDLFSSSSDFRQSSFFLFLGRGKRSVGAFLVESFTEFSNP